jgi:hypothetical protein
VPIEKRDLEAAGPNAPHLALLMDDAGMRLAIPPGASLWLVEDKNRQDKIFPLVLKKVSVKKLVFEMRQADGSAMEYTYSLVSGKPLDRAAHMRLLKNRQGLPTRVQK